MDLGTLTATLGVDTSGLYKAESALKGFGTRAGGVFSSVKNSVLSLQGAMVGLAAYFGVSKLVSYIEELSHVAGRYDEIGIAMNRAGQNAGYSAMEMLKLETGMKKQGIGSIEARESLTRLAASYMDVTKAVKLAAAAQDVAVAAHQNSSETMVSFIQVIQGGNTEMARHLGLQVNFEAAYKKMEQTVGHALSEREKMEARLGEVLKASAGYQGLYNEAMKSAEKQYGTLTRYVDEYKIAFGKAFQPAFLSIMQAKTEMYKKLAQVLTDPASRESLQRLADSFATLYTSFLSKIPDMIVWFGKFADQIRNLEGSFNNLYETYGATVVAIVTVAALPKLITMIEGLAGAIAALVVAIEGGAVITFLSTLGAAIAAVNPIVLALVGTLAVFSGYKIWQNAGKGPESMAIGIEHLREEAGKGHGALKELTAGLGVQIDTWAQLDSLIEQGIVKYDAAAQKFIEVKKDLGAPPPESTVDQQKLEEANKRIEEAIKRSQENIVGIKEGSFAQEMLNIANEVAEYQKAGVAKEKIDTYTATRTAEIRATVNKQIQDQTRESALNIIGINEGAYAKEMALLNDAVAEARRAGTSEVEITKMTEAKKAELRAQTHQQIQDEIRTSEENILGIEQGAMAREMAMLQRRIEERRKLGATPTELKAYEAAQLREITLTSTKERLEAERDLYKDLRGYSGDYFEVTKQLIGEQARAYKALGIDINAVMAWVKEETINAFIEMGKKSDDYRMGVSAAFEEMKRDAMTWGEFGYEITKEYATQSQNILSTVFFDAYKGELKSFMEYFTSFLDSIEKKFLDMCAQMVVDWMMAQIRMKAFSSSSGGLMGILESAIGWVGGLFTGGTGGGATLSSVGSSISSGWNTGGFNLESALKLHGGGRVGYDYAPTMLLPSSLFTKAPRLHGGLDPDEFPAVLKRGERVTTEEQDAKNKKTTPINLAVTNIVSPDLIDSYLATARGQNAILNVISSKSGTVKRVLRK